MQYEDKKDYFIKKVGELIKRIRKDRNKVSISKIAPEYDIDKSSWSKIERGFYSIELATAWKFAEALNIKFSEFIKILEDELGEDFTLIDE